jgi:hypothetical protein
MRYMQLMSVDGNDAIPTEPLGRPQRVLEEEAAKARRQEEAAKVKAARNSVFEKGRHDLTEPKKMAIDGTMKTAEFYMGNYWFLGEPPVPRTSRTDAKWYGLFIFHRDRLTEPVYRKVWEQHKLLGLQPDSLEDFHSLLLALRAAS